MRRFGFSSILLASILAFAAVQPASAESSLHIATCAKPLASVRVDLVDASQNELWEKPHLISPDEAIRNIMKKSGCFTDAVSQGTVADYVLSTTVNQVAMGLQDTGVNLKYAIPVYGLFASSNDLKNKLSPQVSLMLMSTRTSMMGGQSMVTAKKLNVSFDPGSDTSLFVTAGYTPTTEGNSMITAEVVAFNKLVETYETMPHDDAINPLVAEAMRQQQAHK